MLTLYLVRHGEKEQAVLDPGLTELGLRQAQKTGEFLRKFPITRVIASPLLRTQLTAQAIVQSLQLPIETDARLKERMEFTDYEKLGRQAFFLEWNKMTHQRELRPRWGDSSADTGQRIQALVNELDRGQSQHIVLVTHGGAIADFLRIVVNESDLAKIKRVLATGDSYDVQECSVTQLTKRDKTYTLKVLHATKHLED